jgi:hypothetical protein
MGGACTAGEALPGANTMESPVSARDGTAHYIQTTTTVTTVYEVKRKPESSCVHGSDFNMMYPNHPPPRYSEPLPAENVVKPRRLFGFASSVPIGPPGPGSRPIQLHGAKNNGGKTRGQRRRNGTKAGTGGSTSDGNRNCAPPPNGNQNSGNRKRVETSRGLRKETLIEDAPQSPPICRSSLGLDEALIRFGTASSSMPVIFRVSIETSDAIPFAQEVRSVDDTIPIPGDTLTIPKPELNIRYRKK